MKTKKRKSAKVEKPWIQIEHDEICEGFTVTLTCHVAPPGTEPIKIHIGYAETSELVEALERAIIKKNRRQRRGKRK